MKPLNDYSFIKGVNYGMKADPAIVRRDLSYGKRLGVNSVRIWLSYRQFEELGQAYIDQLVRYVRTCHEEGVSVVPILFNGNGMDPAILEDAFIPRQEAFTAAVVSALRDEPGLLMYDAMNEPPCNDLILHAPHKEARDEVYRKIWRFLRRVCEQIKALDPVNALTVGHWLAEQIDQCADLADVLSYHDYSPTIAGVRAAAERALESGRKWGKPVINNETCCIARANPYDQVIQVLDEYRIPWYVFNLMIEGYWNDVHGIFYPDGTVRDPAIAAAMVGCFRSRDVEAIVPEKPNREHQASDVLGKLRALLADSEPDVFAYKGMKVTELLDACEHAANLIESGQLAPMQIPPTARIAAWRKQEKPNVLDIKNYAVELADILKKGCHII